MNTKISSQLMLNSYDGSSYNTGKTKCKWLNVNLQTILGDDYEVGAKYNLILKNIIRDGLSGNFSNTLKSGNIDLECDGMIFNCSKIQNDRMERYNKAQFSYNFLNYSTCKNYILNNIATFTLTKPIANIEVQFMDIITGQLIDEGETFLDHGLNFDIWKIDKPYLTQITNALVLNTYDYTTTNATRTDVKWYMVDFKTILGDDYELNGWYNITLKLIQRDVTIGNTTGTLNRSGWVHITCDCCDFHNHRINNGGMMKTGAIFCYKTNNVNTEFSENFHTSNICSFKLLKDKGAIRLQVYSQGTEALLTANFGECIYLFDIIKIK